MADRHSVLPANHGRSFGRPRAFESIVYGGLAIGVLDGLAAGTNAYLRGGTPSRVFQYVASGWLGPSSYNHGLRSVLLGVFFHFCVAFGAATVFLFFSRSFPILIRNALLFGPLYGIAVYFFMGRIVVPLSNARRLPFSYSSLITGIIIHILFVGLPIALLARRSARVHALTARI